MRVVRGMPDRLHMLARLRATRANADTLGMVKANPSKWYEPFAGLRKELIALLGKQEA